MGNAKMADRSGQQLDIYRLIRLLGRGTFGEVYLGENMRRKTQVAVKVLHNQLTGEELHGFLNEARIFRLKHPNIISILDFGVERSTNVPFLIMEYAPNGTLRQHHPKGTIVPLSKIVLYAKDIARALQYAHEENLVHRDIKPENLLVGLQGEILLSDFGIAVLSRSERFTPQNNQEIAGTPNYMAPEQFLGKPGRACDQYALGIIVYEWLSGVCPFHGTFIELAHQHLQSLPPPLRGKVPTISPDVERVVMLTLEKDPQKRFASVQAFATALEEAASREWDVISTPTISQKTKEQWCRDGRAHYKDHHYEAAIMAYNRAIELDAAYAAAYYCRGIVYYHLREYEKTMADYNQAIELDHRFTDAYYSRGTLFHFLGEHRKAIIDFDHVIKLDPIHTATYNNRGLAYLALKEYRKAIADFDRAITLDSRFAHAFCNRGLAYTDLTEYRKAIADFDRAIELTPEYSVLYYNRGLAYTKLKEYRRAIWDFDYALNLNPKDAAAYAAKEEVYHLLQEQKQRS